MTGMSETRNQLGKCFPVPISFHLAVAAGRWDTVIGGAREDSEMTPFLEPTDGPAATGRFSVDFDIANAEDLIEVKKGYLPVEQVRRARLSGVVDTGATRLVLPGAIVKQLGLPKKGPITVQLADGRRDQKTAASHAQVEILRRSRVFTAVVEPNRKDALIGAIVLEELDLIPDCTRQRLIPRDPKGIFAELE